MTESPNFQQESEHIWSPSPDFRTRTDSDTIFVEVPLWMLQWLKIGLHLGRVATSPYCIKDSIVYDMLDYSVTAGEQACQHSNRRSDGFCPTCCKRDAPDV